MNTGAIVMLVLGLAGLWGGLALAIANYLRRARRDRGDTG